MLTNKKVAIIGVGKMGETLLNGMINNNLVYHFMSVADNRLEAEDVL